MRTLSLPTAAATDALGHALAAALFPGAFLALRGDLGAGKSSLARALARGLGIEGPVPSPTFVLVNTYEGRLPLVHADWYRLCDAEELEQLGWDEIATAEVVTVVEWVERAEEVLPADRLELALAYEGDGRIVTLEATGPRHEVLEHAGG